MGFGPPNAAMRSAAPPEGSQWRLYLLIVILVATALLVLAAIVFTPP